ncbi:MAG: hypothetical protein P8M22_01560 [Phycisphaerales bacterium]|nr:hypothetical protein [Phycisphaerales bacterium]
MSAIRTSIGVIFIAIFGVLSPASAAPSSISIPDNIRQHVPADAFLLVYTPSAQKLISALGTTVGSVDPQTAMQLQRMPMMGGMMLFSNEDPSKQAQLDLDAPAALALSQGAAGIEPSMTVIIGVKGDHKGLKPLQPGMRMSSIKDSSLVAMTNAVEGPAMASGAQLLQNIPPGEINIAFDQQLFYKQYGPMIDLMMSQMGGNPAMQQNNDPAAKMMQEQAARSAAQLKMFMEMFKSWDFAMTFDGPDMSTTVRWIPTDPNMKATGSADLGEYSKVLVNDSPLAMVMSHSALKMMIQMQSDQDMAMPAAFGDFMKIVMTHATNMIDDMDGSSGVSYGLGSKGLWCLQLFKLKNKDAYMKETAAMFAAVNDAGIGVSVSDLKLIQPGVGYTVRVDMQEIFSKMGMAGMIPPKEMAMITSVVDALLGGEVGMQIRYLTNGNKVAVVCGRNGQVLGRAKQILESNDAGKPNTLDSLVSTAQGSPTMVMSLEFRSMFGEILGFMHSVPALKSELNDVPSSAPAGDPIRLNATCTAMTKGGQMIIDFNLGGFATMIKEMEAIADKNHQKAAMAN